MKNCTWRGKEDKGGGELSGVSISEGGAPGGPLVSEYLALQQG